MHVSIKYLDEALDVSRQELIALRRGDVDAATQLSKKRTELMQLAWDTREDCVRLVYKEKLLLLRQLQVELIKLVNAGQGGVKKDLLRSKQEGRRLAGYKQAMQHAM